MLRQSKNDLSDSSNDGDLEQAAVTHRLIKIVLKSNNYHGEFPAKNGYAGMQLTRTCD